MKEVVEYTTNDEGYIIGWAIYPYAKRRDLKDYVLPNYEMVDLIDIYGKYKYMLDGYAPIAVTQDPTTIDLYRLELNKSGIKKIIKCLIDGIDNGSEGLKYAKLKEIVFGSNGT